MVLWKILHRLFLNRQQYYPINGYCIAFAFFQKIFLQEIDGNFKGPCCIFTWPKMQERINTEGSPRVNHKMIVPIGKLSLSYKKVKSLYSDDELLISVPSWEAAIWNITSGQKNRHLLSSKTCPAGAARVEEWSWWLSRHWVVGCCYTGRQQVNTFH